MAPKQAAQAWHQAGQGGLRMGNGGGEVRVGDVHEHLPVLEIVMDDTQAISQRRYVFLPTEAGAREQPDCVDVAKS